MRRSRHFVLAVPVFLVLLCAQSAAAADLTGFVGGIKPGSLTISNVRTSLDSSPIYGLRLGYNFVPLLGMEHTIAFSSGFLLPSSLKDVVHAKGFVYSANLILTVPVGRAVPYATAGVGLLRQYGAPDLPVGTKLAFNYGGGLKLPHLLGPLGLRFDARGYTATGIFSSSLSLLEVSAGVLISF